MKPRSSYMIDQRLGQLAIAQKTSRSRWVAAPAAEMDLVYRNRRVERDSLPALSHPVGIVPPVVEVPYDRAGPWWDLSTNCEWVGFLENLTLSRR